jgi:hypothetical protein
MKNSPAASTQYLFANPKLGLSSCRKAVQDKKIDSREFAKFEKKEKNTQFCTSTSAEICE